MNNKIVIDEHINGWFHLLNSIRPKKLNTYTIIFKLVKN